MELPKETIERIDKDALNRWPINLVHRGDKTTDDNLLPRLATIYGAESEALRSLSEIEKLKIEKGEIANEMVSFIQRANKAESIVTELEIEVEKLKEEIKSLEYWQKEKEIEVNLEQVSLAVGEAEKEFNDFHQQQLIELKAKYFDLESQNKELILVMLEIINHPSNINWINKAKSLLKSLPNKEA